MSDVKGRAREALTGITPGPWEHHIGPPDETPAEYCAGTLIGEGEPLHVLTAPSPDPKFDYVVPAITGDGPTSAANAEFIAAAPVLVADLLSLVEEQEQKLAAIRADCLRWGSDMRLPQEVSVVSARILQRIEGD